MNAEVLRDQCFLALADWSGGVEALEQAGAFIFTRRGTLQDYRRRWQAQDQKVREYFDPRMMQYPRSVATTWETTREQLSEPARALLNLLAWLAPEPLPRWLFESEAANRRLARALAGPEVAQIRRPMGRLSNQRQTWKTR